MESAQPANPLAVILLNSRHPGKNNNEYSSLNSASYTKKSYENSVYSDIGTASADREKAI